MDALRHRGLPHAAVVMTPETATVHVDEIFLSLQGEGLEVGRPQLFLRLGGCPLRCTYCDTPRSWQASGSLSIQEIEAELDRLLHEAGLRCEQIMLSVTGGEPLEQVDFLAAWLPTWGGLVLLETAGVYAAKLRLLLPYVHLLSLDWKLPNTVRQGESLLEPAACLAVAVVSGVAVQVKLVVTAMTTRAELEDAFAAIAKISPGCTVFLQPVTQFGAGPGPPTGKQLLDWSLQLFHFHLDLRVLPQIHPMLGIR